MSNCDNELNSQIKALHARLDRVDDDLVAHFSAQYLQAISFLANPLTAAQGAVMTAQFASREAFKKLVTQLPGYEEFKQLQHLDAASLVESLEETLIKTANGMVDLAASKVQSTVDAQVAALRDYTLAIEENAIDSVVGPLLDTLNETTTALNKANAAVGAIQAFLNTLKNISSCKVDTAIVRK